MDANLKDKPLPYAGMTAFAPLSKKGGAGRTETCDLIEAVLTLGGSKCLLVDADDGNRGLLRRVGDDEVVKLSWETRPEDAADWLGRHAYNHDVMIFDLGSGIDSSDLPVMSFLSTLWSKLHAGGAKLLFPCIVSTNARVSPSFVERALTNYGRFGEILILNNNKDGSQNFPAELECRPERRIALRKAQAGLQAVRLMKTATLSSLVMNPVAGYSTATAMIAARILAFARQPVINELVSASAVEKLAAAAVGVRPLRFNVTTSADATDERLALNAKLAAAHQSLLMPKVGDEMILATALAYREAFSTWNRTLGR